MGAGRQTALGTGIARCLGLVRSMESSKAAPRGPAPLDAKERSPRPGSASGSGVTEEELARKGAGRGGGMRPSVDPQLGAPKDSAVEEAPFGQYRRLLSFGACAGLKTSGGRASNTQHRWATFR